MNGRWKIASARVVQTSAQLVASQQGASIMTVLHRAPVISLWTCLAMLTVTVRRNRMILAHRRRTAYHSCVPEKKGNRLGRLNTQSAQTAPCGFFSCVCLRTSPMSGGGGEAFGLAGFFGYQSTNPAICRSPRLVAGRGVTATQGGPHA
jgi:hypothetical protein